MSNTDGRTNDSSGISAAVTPGGKHTQQSNDPEQSRLATSETPQQHSSIGYLRLPAVVSHIQRIGCQPEKNYFTGWPIPLVVY